MLMMNAFTAMLTPPPPCIFATHLQKQEIVRLSNEFVNKLVTAAEAPKGHADPQLLLDYRCYLPGASPRAEVWKAGRLLALLPAGCVTV